MPAPAIIWHSDPVQPGETVLLTGDFPADAAMEVVRLDDHGVLPAAAWTRIAPLRSDAQSLHAVLPDGRPGVWACRVAGGGGVSAPVLLNAPVAWWIQGEEGLGRTAPGGWLGAFGKCLGAADAPRGRLVGPGGAIALEPGRCDGWAARFTVPADVAAGGYRLELATPDCGGWADVGAVAVGPRLALPQTTLSVLDFGADPTGLKDCSLAVVQGMERLAGIGGGVLLFPAGRYRIDGVLRSGQYGPSPLRVAHGVTLRGEGMDLTSLWWPDRAEPLPSLVECYGHCAVEDLAIFTQGRHRNIITVEGDDVRVRRVRIRANCHYMCGPQGAPHHERGVSESPHRMGWAIDLWGRNLEVVDCDIYHSAGCIFPRQVRGGVIARNACSGLNFTFASGLDGVVMEDNTFTGNSLTAGGNGLSLFFGPSICRHVYYARNHMRHLYGGDHENLTLDGHGTAYLGAAEATGPATVRLAGDPVLGRGGRDALPDTNDCTLWIHDGRGAGQYRRIVSRSGRDLVLDAPWTVVPDAGSLFSIGSFSGRHLIIGNTGEDTGTLVQLYPPNCECIVAGNRGIRASGINSLSKLGRHLRIPFHRVEPSWYNQFLGNHVVAGNGWGGGESEVDRWLGGEATMQVRGWQVAFYEDEHGHDQDRPLTADDLAALAGVRRDRAVPLSRGVVIRHHRVDSNSSIRIRGAVRDVLIEDSDLRRSRRGIRIDCEVGRPQPRGMDQLDHEKPEHAAIPFLRPDAVVLRRNRATAVAEPVTGSALDGVVIA